MSPITRARTAAVSLAAVLALGGLAACGSDSSTSTSSATTAGSGSLTVTDVWARESAMVSGDGAAYFTITNGTGAEDELTAVSVPSAVAGTAQMHETVESSGDMSSGTTMAGSGMMTMREVESVPVPAGGTVMFAPGGYHVMLVELVKPLEVGTSVPLTLTFKDAGEVTVSAEVRAS